MLPPIFFIRMNQKPVPLIFLDRLDTKAFGLKKTSRIKAFVFKFISVPAKWIRTARHYELNIYTHNKSYQAPFALTGG